MTPLVSIIIPTYNRAHLIGETLDSVLTQTYSNWECIIVDDGSTDDTAAVMATYLKKDARFQYHHRPSNRLRGGNAARNYGFEISKGEYINFFDSDDLMVFSKLEEQLNIINTTKSVLCVCQSELFKKNDVNFKKLKREKIFTENFFNDFICKKLKWLTPEPLFAKKFLLENNIQFDENLVQSQDRDFMLKVFSKIKIYAYITKPLVKIRIHANNISSNPTAKKVYADFSVTLKSLINYKELMDIESVLFTQKRMQLTYRKGLRLKFNKISLKMLSKLLSNEVNLSITQKINMILAFITFSMFNKGEQFFK